ncbi:MAG: sulfide-dependent adenosine diphosphate thiazole synthase [Armatimonadetes bacterium]|nr:sulfide-dependent adenosine diphosphate thiazole synthase [Armatimonadota bacterium]
MQIEDIVVSRAIITRYTGDLLAALDTDVAIAGGGPAGLTAARYLAEKNLRVVVFESKLSVGGGMWGGGMMFNQIVVQEEAKPILDELGVRCEVFQEGYYTANSVEAVAALILGAVRAGAKIFNLICAEDVMVRNGRITGLVLNWKAVEMANLHVDPLAVQSRYVIDATGHDAQVVNFVVHKLKAPLQTAGGGLEGEKSMWAERGEGVILENTREVYPGLYVAGMTANAVCGGHRMGPIFGGMLLSGRKAAQLIIEREKK